LGHPAEPRHRRALARPAALGPDPVLVQGEAEAAADQPKSETVAKIPMFRDAYRKRRCIMPVDLFFEWKAIKGARAKQPYAIGMKDGSAFGLAGLWENWKYPSTGEWTRTFAILTTNANELVADIHDRMPVILKPEDFDRWLGSEPDPRDLLRPFPAELMRMWPISPRVNSPKNDDPELLTPVPPDSSPSPDGGPNSA
jgi:putative SOS response-associated peptidase YedK